MRTLFHFLVGSLVAAILSCGVQAAPASVYARDYVQKAYVAYYGRPGDPAGLAYWANRMDAKGGSLDAIIAAFGTSDEFNRRYGGLGNTALVTKIYQQALNRDPDPVGLAWYVNELQAGRRTPQTIALDVLNGAVTPPDSTVVANKLDVADYYTAKVMGGCNYGTEQDGVAFLSAVTADAATVTMAKAAIDGRCIVPASVTVESPTLSPWVGELVLLTAVARDASGAILPGMAATWSSSNPTLATISATGVLQGVATGSVEVTATINGVSGSRTLTITPTPRIGVTVGSTKEVVFAYKTDHCADSDLDFPDLPPHIVRAEDGSLVLFASAAPRFYVSRGADFNSLKRDCSQPVLVSPDLRTPQSYENREWISAVYREGNRWHALISNEFIDKVASTCLVPGPSLISDCLYLSATYAVSTDGARTFTKPSPPAHVVLPPPYVWEPPLPGAPPNWERGFHEGYNAPYSLVRKDDGFVYAIVGLAPSKSVPYAGQCFLRTNRLDDPSSWRAWDGAGFNDPIRSPYVVGNPAPLCKTNLDLPGGLLTFNTYLNRYMNLDTWHSTIDGKLFCSFVFRLSADLLHWSAPQLITQAGDPGFCPPDPQGSTYPAMYPTLIDHADTTINFERPGRTPHLYYARFNDSWKDRDLVRVPLTFTRLD